MGNVNWKALLVFLFLQAVVVGVYVGSMDAGTDARRDSLNRMCWTYGNATGNAYDVWSGDKYYVVLCSDNPTLRAYVENVSRDAVWREMARSRS